MSEQLRYTDEELEEFRQLILAKIESATSLYEELCASLRNNDGNDTADTSPTFKVLEEGASTLEREAKVIIRGGRPFRPPALHIRYAGVTTTPNLISSRSSISTELGSEGSPVVMESCGQRRRPHGGS